MKRRQARKIARCPDLNHRRPTRVNAQRVIMAGFRRSLNASTRAFSKMAEVTSVATRAFAALALTLARNP